MEYFVEKCVRYSRYREPLHGVLCRGVCEVLLVQGDPYMEYFVEECVRYSGSRDSFLMKQTIFLKSVSGERILKNMI